MIYSGISDEAGNAIETQIKAHQALGWDHIEIRRAGEKNLTDVDDAEFERVLGLVRDAGLTITCFASQLGNWSRDITGDFEVDKAELARSIPRMQKAGTKYIRTMTWRPAGASREEWKTEAIRRMRELAAMAADGGVALAHENCTGWASEGPDETVELMDAVDSPGLVVLYDTGNSVGYGKDTLAFLHGVLDRIAYVHIKDMVKEPDGKAHGVWPGTGHSVLRQQLQEIFASGYDGVFSIEPHVASVIHEGKSASAEELYESYVKYGRMFMELVESVTAEG
jgi:sugar phosphate isomerase/epimerase